MRHLLPSFPFFFFFLILFPHSARAIFPSPCSLPSRLPVGRRERTGERLFTEAGHRVEGALLPVATLALQIADVQLIAESLHDLLGEQVIYQGRLDAAVVVYQLKIIEKSQPLLGANRRLV